MRSLCIVEAKIPVNANTCISRGLVTIGVDIFVLYAAPQPFDKDVVVSPSPVVHADPGACIEEDICKLWACEVAPLITVHNLRSGCF